jgi:hypothetical protein
VVAVDEGDEGLWESKECSIAAATGRISSGEVRERDMEADSG